MFSRIGEKDARTERNGSAFASSRSATENRGGLFAMRATNKLDTVELLCHVEVIVSEVTVGNGGS